jgi:hypothetical protein
MQDGTMEANSPGRVASCLHRGGLHPRRCRFRGPPREGFRASKFREKSLATGHSRKFQAAHIGAQLMHAVTFRAESGLLLYGSICCIVFGASRRLGPHPCWAMAKARGPRRQFDIWEISYRNSASFLRHRGPSGLTCAMCLASSSCTGGYRHCSEIRASGVRGL